MSLAFSVWSAEEGEGCAASGALSVARTNIDVMTATFEKLGDEQAWWRGGGAVTNGQTVAYSDEQGYYHNGDRMLACIRRRCDGVKLSIAKACAEIRYDA